MPRAAFVLASSLATLALAACSTSQVASGVAEAVDPGYVEVTDSGTCASGNCAFACPVNERCTFSCAGGHCLQICSERSECRMTCTGGYCDQRGEANAEVFATCDGGYCNQRCATDFGCNMMCAGGRCR